MYQVNQISQQSNIISPPRDRIFALPDSKFVSVLRVRISVRCRNCGNQWGVSYSNDTLDLPLAWDVCKICGENNKKQNENSDMVAKVEQGEQNERETK